MNKIPSFTIDHLRLLPGVYVSRRDVTPSGDILTTFDIRMTAPNREPALAPEVLHTIEHLAATWLRNNKEWSDKIIYWGPMGCCTGSYLIMAGNFMPQDIAELMQNLFKWIADFDGEIPGATARDCGNYTFNDLAGAKVAARKFYENTLLHLDRANTNYPD